MTATLLRRVNSTITSNDRGKKFRVSCIEAGLVGDERLAVDVSLIKADAKDDAAHTVRSSSG
jgi:hypothetical protein